MMNGGITALSVGIEMRNLTKSEIRAMEAIVEGGDVYDHTVAINLRAVDRDFPKYVVIGPAMRAPKDGAKQQPFFGAILTEKGKRVLESVLTIEGEL